MMRRTMVLNAEQFCNSLKVAVGTAVSLSGVPVIIELEII
jgi:hypothetical protein